MLKFLGRGSAFADKNNCAFFVEDNELVLIDCPATAFHEIKKWELEAFDNIYILVTHTHGDHSGGVGTMLQYVWFSSEMKKRVTVVAPSEQVKEDLLLLLMRIEGCEKEWFNITTADALHRDWLVSSIATTHVKPLEGKCFGYHLRVKGSDVVYTGDTASLTPYLPLIKKGTYLYTEAAYIPSGVHLSLKEMLPEFIRLAENGVHVYLMHLDHEDDILKMIEGTPLRPAELYATTANQTIMLV